MLLTFCVSSADFARADSWPLPETQEYLSPNGQYRFTVVPRDVNSQLEYFEDKLEGEVLPDTLGPTGTLEQNVNGRWTTVWSDKLVNEVAPVDALVKDDGSHVVTFDNWHSTGFGENVVVIYGTEGKPIRSFALENILPSYFLDGFGRSVSSLHWRDEGSRMSTDLLHLVFNGPKNAKSVLPRLTIDIVLSSGTVGQIAADNLAALKPAFCAAHKATVSDHNSIVAFERNLLVAPSTGDPDEWAWRRYVHHATERLKPTEDLQDDESWMGETDFELLLPGEYMEKDFRDSFRTALIVPAAELKRRWFFSKDQERMTREIEKTARAIKPGQLSGTDMRFFADNLHWPRIQKTLLPSGANLTQIDTEKPIPQTSERLASLPPDKQVDAACVN